MREFPGKVAVITGAASGIGRSLAQHCVRAGIKTVLADIDEPALAETCNNLKALGGEVLAVTTDVSQRADVERLAQQAFSTFGHVHLLFNNAGVAAGGPAWEASWNDWEWVLGVNLWGVIHGVKVFTPLMLAQGTECHIVNTASAAGLMAGGFSAPYSVSKHAVVALSEGLFLTLQNRGPLVGVSVLCPGVVQTSIHETERHRPAAMRNQPVPLTPELEAGRKAFREVLEQGMSPDRVAEIVFDAIERQQFYIFTHPDWIEGVRLRTESLLRLENPQSPAALIQKLVNPRRSNESAAKP